MNLRVEHEKNVGRIVDSNKFGVAIKLESQDGLQKQGFDIGDELFGEYNRIARVYDPETNLPVITNKSSVVLRLSDLKVTPLRSWKITVDDITGETVNGLITDSGDKDRTIGFVVFLFTAKE